ncbi:cytochrome c3 family protein [Gemmatimonas aurantiaca]|uniref:cytochrome c3 family protein n=1 Tax=Gemmatimonas aurantiaca TaxID=173480 RepID=UPI00301BC513
MRHTFWPLRLAVALLAATAMSGCSSDTIVYRDRAPFNIPADSATGYLGYYNIAARQTTCGNCHVDYQRSWKDTKHASAFATLRTSMTPQITKDTLCAGCHSVNGNGNATETARVGYMKVRDSSYMDVQCESCHGPGLKHVEGVGNATVIRPLPKLSMTGKGTCGDCHSGTHQPFAEEWEQSNHANVNASRASNASCQGCHEGRGALAKWGVKANFAEKDNPTAYVAITCAVCHDPHGSPNSAQLRFPITTTDPERNLCIKCHMRVAEPTVTSSSPHAPQGAVLLGMGGWRPPGFAYDTARIFGSHATEKNPKLCAGCHVGRFTGTDKANGEFSFQATGHLMRPVPCLDAAGKPTGSKTCAYTTTARSWQTCAASGCHANAAAAANAFTTIRSRMKFYTDQLWTDLNGNGSMQASPTDGGLLPTLRQSKPTEWSTTDQVITPAEGAEFNARLCGEYGQSNADNSKGIHNPFLCEALLISTISYLRTYYALPATAQATLPHGPIGGEFNRNMVVTGTSPK